MLIARFVVGFIFIFAAIGKISDPELFARQINNYDIMPYYLINFLALLLPWVELFCGIMLMLGVRLRASSVLTGAMLIMFIGAVGIAMLKGLSIECGCFSAQSETVGWKKIAENTGQLMVCVLLYFKPDSTFTLERLVLNENNASAKA